MSFRRNGIILRWKKIFFEEKIYKELEKKHETWDKVLEAIDKAFIPFKKQLKKRNYKRRYYQADGETSPPYLQTRY